MDKEIFTLQKGTKKPRIAAGLWVKNLSQI